MLKYLGNGYIAAVPAGDISKDEFAAIYDSGNISEWGSTLAKAKKAIVDTGLYRLVVEKKNDKAGNGGEANSAEDTK